MNISRTFGALLFVSALAVAGGSPESTQQDLHLTIGKSVVIDYPVEIGRISTSNPDVVDASPVTTRELLLHGKSSGTVTVIVWSKAGERTFYNISVEQNLEPLRHLLKDTFPAAEIHVESSHDTLALTGRVPDKDVADRVVAMATSFGKQIVNNLVVDAAPVQQQVLLHVKFADVDRTAASQWAFNLISTGATNTIGRITTGGAVAPTPGSIGGGQSTFSISDALNIFAFRPDLNLAATIQALQSRNLLQILAEPNLVTSDGKEASFLVGGEFPIPVLQGGGNSGAVTIQFREFGIRLNFTPEITGNHTIRMHVRPEVSSLDYTHAVSISGFVIPALSSRKMETNVELGEGQTFVIAGLIDNEVTESFAKIPGLASIPILGEFFKSRSLTKSKNELLVMVTPEITHPLQPGQPAPIPVMPREFMGSALPTSVDTAKAASHARK
ncbi:MAG TPA: type II and III secretion system protein family protein [Bryobacteraceae bacterium]|nr:type II and III secretion system protein family protein [Bryobacteraceae bacterium]